MNIAKSYDFFKPENCRERIHIIGCGAIGSTLAENLVRYGLTKITLYDFDDVQSHNIANQMFTDEDIGKMKVQALKDYLVKINPDVKNNIRLVETGYTNQRLYGYVFLCVDNIDLRRQIAEANKYNPSIVAMFDFRMGLTDAQHFAADWKDPDSIRAFISTMQFSHDEAKESTPVSACNLTLSVCSTVRMIISLGVANFVNFIKNNSMKKMILANAFEYQIDAV